MTATTMCSTFCGFRSSPPLLKENVPLETFNKSFESTQNKQQYGIENTSIKVGKKLW